MKIGVDNIDDVDVEKDGEKKNVFVSKGFLYWFVYVVYGFVFLFVIILGMFVIMYGM